MKYFGTVDPETGGNPLRFAQGSGSWTHVAPPRPGQRLSYDVHHTNGRSSAVNLETI